MACALAGALAACVKPPKAPNSPLVDISPAESGDDGGGELLRELELEVLASYDRFVLDPASAADAIDPVVGLTAIGVGPQEVGASGVQSRWPVIAVDGQEVEVVSRALELHLSADRTVGWTFDQISLHLQVCGRTATIPLRVAQVYARDSERWTLVSEHLAYAQPMGRWLDEATGPVGAPMPGAIERSDDAAAAAAALTSAFTAEADRQATWDSAPDALAVWPDPLQLLRGDAVVTGPSLAASMQATAIGVEGVRLALGPGRQSAIAATTLVVTVDRAAGPVAVRLRATAVLEPAAGKAWRVRMAMVSAPIGVPALVARTLGVIATSVTGNKVTATCTPGPGKVAALDAPPVSRAWARCGPGSIDRSAPGRTPVPTSTQNNPGPTCGRDLRLAPSR
ncbi:MAG TPA: hypothetical protein VHE35_03760 [Kofleriaceae bacterium]|nr:hypothetical protein [Kofleriaceae bacterium]